ncbi:MAG: sialidase family protein [Candidatus Baltobacteraceae bacterium]
MKNVLRALLGSLVLSSCIVAKDAYAPPLAGGVRQNALPSANFENERRWGNRFDYRWEPSVAADPSSSWVYQITTDQRPNYLLFRASPDGGRSWLAASRICRRGTRVPWQFDPQIAVTPKGIVYAICLDGFRPGIVFTRSRDHGRTWSPNVRLDKPLRYSDKPTLVAASAKDVYVAFNSYYALYVAASHDGGLTWQPPVKATTKHRWYYSYGGTAASDGSVWFAVDGETGPDQTGGGHIELVTSADRGATWRNIPFAVTREGAPCNGHQCYPDFYTGQDAVAVDRTGAYVFVFAKNETKQGPNALYASHSSDGEHWSVPSAINTLGNNTSPAIASGIAAGDFRLVWQDNRNGTNAWNTWFARSADAGATWSKPIRLSNRGAGESYKRRAGYDFPFGDYLGLAVDSHGVDHVIWGEGAGIYYPGSTWWTRD